MDKLKQIIEGLEMSYRYSNVDEGNTLVPQQLVLDTITLLKAQEQATIDPKCIDLADETKAWLDKMDAVEALSNIADICMDWDGYRTANGLGGLVNEIWAYARYCADMLQKMQEPHVMTLEEVKNYTNVVYVECNTDYCEQFVPALVNPYKNSYTCVLLRYATRDQDARCESYNKTWRCWTSRPTDEQREAMKWE